MLVNSSLHRFPFLLSLQFFLKLSAADFNHSQYHLSSRWAHLATVFESADMTDEAQLAQAGAALCRCFERNIENTGCHNSEKSDSILKIIHILAGQSKHLFATQSYPMVYNDKDSVITRKLVALTAPSGKGPRRSKICSRSSPSINS